MAEGNKKNFSIENIDEKIKRFLNPKVLALTIGGILLALFLLFAVSKFSTQTNYGVLYSHLNPDDAGSVLTVLQEEKTPYKIEGDGSIILVPKDKIYDIRLKLAAKGLPSGKSVGFEIFDEPKLGITQFQEQIEYLRALEGELERTIRQLDAVRDVKINIALPKDSIFVREEDSAKSSVILKLWPGRDLNKEQVKSIVFLVSHAVPGLKPENVTVADNRGRVLSDLLTEEENTPGKEIEIKKQMEKELARKVENILSKALGSKKVIARASVEIETGKVEKQSETYDPDMTAVVSERKIQEKESGTKETQQGPPGANTNVPPVIDNGQNNNIITNREKKDITTNYDVSKTVEKKTARIFIIKKLSIGVLIDGKYKKTEEGEKFIPRSPEELKTYEMLVKSVVGFDEKRGDKVTVVSVPFETPKKEMPLIKTEVFPIIPVAIGGGILLIVIIGATLLILRRKKSALPTQIDAEIAAKTAYESPAEDKMAKERKEIENFDIKSEPTYLKILELSQEHPELIAQLIKEWVGEKLNA